MVFKHPPMSNDVACGSDHAYPVTLDRAAGSDEQSWNTVSVETSRVDLCFSLEFLQRQAEAQRRKAWNYRQNLKHRKWEAWERTTMIQEDTNTWANIPSDSSFGPSRSRGLRKHVLQMAIQCEKQHRQDLQALDVSLPRTPVEMQQRRSKSPLTEADIAEAKALDMSPPRDQEVVQNKRSHSQTQDTISTYYIRCVFILSRNPSGTAWVDRIQFGRSLLH